MSTLRIAIVAAAASLGLVLGAAASERAGPANESEGVSTWSELHASRARLVAGQVKRTVRLAGVEITMDDGWKTYWRMPGDAGVPPQFDWSGSSNVANVKVLYPAPMRMREADGHVIGYKQAVLFPIEVTPQDATKPVALKLSLEFGICRDICVPATAAFELSLPPDRSSEHAEAIAAATERVPRPPSGRRSADPELRHVRVDAGASGARLSIAAAFHGHDGADVFVEAPEGLYVPLPRVVGKDPDGVWRFAADLSSGLARDLKGKTLTLTLVSEAGATEAQWRLP